MKDRELHKYYLCVIHGTLSQKKGILKGFLVKDEKKTRCRCSLPAPDAKTIQTAYTVLGEKNGLSLLEVNLLTGRTHQIRAHFASIGHPLLGDGKYGTNAQNKRFGYKSSFYIPTS